MVIGSRLEMVAFFKLSFFYFIVSPCEKGADGIVRRPPLDLVFPVTQERFFALLPNTL